MAIRFTHGYDLLSKIGAMVGGFMIVAAGADLLSPISNSIESGLKSSNLEWVWIILMLASIIGGYIGAIMLLGKTILPIGYRLICMYGFRSLQKSPRTKPSNSVFYLMGRLVESGIPSVQFGRLTPRSGVKRFFALRTR